MGKAHQLIIALILSLTASIAAQAEDITTWQIVIMPDVFYQSNNDNQAVREKIYKSITDQLAVAYSVISPDVVGLPNCIRSDCQDLTFDSVKRRVSDYSGDINAIVFYTVKVDELAVTSGKRYQLTFDARIHSLEFDEQVPVNNEIQKTRRCVNVNDCQLAITDVSEVLAQDAGYSLTQQFSSLIPDYQKRRTAILLSRVAALLVLLLLATFLYIAYLKWCYRKHDHQLQRFALEQQATQWMQYFDSLKVYLGPRKKAWQTEQQKWLDHIKQSDVLAEQAWLLSDKYDYLSAKQKIEGALLENADNERALELKAKVNDFQRGYERFQRAEQEIESHTTSALQYLVEAKNLNPHLKEKIQVLEARCHNLLHQQIGVDAMQKAQSAHQASAPYEALSIVDKALSVVANQSSYAQETEQLLQLRSTITNGLTALQGAATGNGQLADTDFFTSDEIQIARSSTVATPQSTIPLGYKRISGQNNQSRITRQGNNYFIADIRSSNGTYLNGTLLNEGAKAQLTDGAKISLGLGKTTKGNDICQLVCKQIKGVDNAMSFRLQQESLRFMDSSATGLAWASMETDMAKTWVAFSDKIPLSLNAQGKLQVGAASTAEVLAFIIYRQCFLIAPHAVDESGEPLLNVNGSTQYAEVPLQADSTVQIAGNTFSFSLLTATE